MATVWIILAQVFCLQMISATIMNIAYGKEASMSSQYAGHVALTAVDGNTNAVYPGGIIHTAEGQTTAWWKVDLARNVQEATVKIYFRTDSSTTNIAYGKEASMSSNFGGFHASTALNGDTNAVYPGGIIYTAQNQSTAWWKVDMMRFVQETTLQIYFRTDYKYRRNGVQLYTSTTPFSIYPSGQLCHTFTGRTDGTDILDVVSVNCTGTWRYLMVYTQTDNNGQGAVLDFGELKVQVCSTGNYGPNCIKSCRSRQCAVTPTSCYRYTAKCPEGRCKTGWTGSDCTEVCLTGNYGQNCMKPCASRHCAVKPASCNIVTGACPSGECLAGYNRSDCTQGCSSGFYGKNCANSCGSRNCVTVFPTCDSETGACSGGCQPGWNGTDCSKNKSCMEPLVHRRQPDGCLQGTYGSACSMSCGNRKCANSSSSCDFVSGKCVGECQPGWNGTDCTKDCSTGRYGLNCEILCSSRQCETFSETCDHVTGNCSGGCKAGWMGTDCMKVCSNGNYGVNCQKSCADRHCKTSSSCDRETGQCSPDGCQDTWTGTDCTDKCPDGTYGINCSNCSMRHCKGKSGCPTDGTCSDGCQDGWILPTCTQASSTGLDPATISVTSVLIGAVLMFILCAGSFLCLLRLGRLKWVKASDESTEMDDISNTQITSQTLAERPQSKSCHAYSNDYAMLDVQTKSGNEEYDVIRSRDYENI